MKDTEKPLVLPGVGMGFGDVFSVMLAEPVLVGSLVSLAVTKTVCCVVMLEGAVYNPDAESTPAPLRLQVMAVLDAPVMTALNCWVWFAVRLAVAGLTLTETLAAGFTVMLALELTVESVARDAVAVIFCELVIVAGAVYSPLLERLPTAGFNDQTIDGLAKAVAAFATTAAPLFTVAANCSVCPGTFSVAVAGVREIVCLAGGLSDTTAVANFDGSAARVAVMVMVWVAAMVAGAVYTPPDNVPTAGLRDQLTVALPVPLTVAVKV